MASNASTAWFVFPSTGSDSNGGGFVAGSVGGTNYANQSSPIATGVATSASTTVTFVLGVLTSAMVGNYMTDGTTWVYITAVSTAFVCTVNSAPSWTAATLNVGGAVKTIGKINAIAVASNKIFVKAEATITTTATISLTFTGSAPLNTVPATRLIGFTTTPGDGGKVTIALSTNTGLKGISSTTIGMQVENFIVDCGNLGTSTGISLTGASSVVRFCTVKNFTTAGIVIGGLEGTAYANEVTGGGSAATSGIDYTVGSQLVIFNYVHDNACSGIFGLNSSVETLIIFNLITNNTGASSDGIGAKNGVLVIGNTIYGSGRHGINSTSTNIEFRYYKNNILAKNGASGTGYGIQLAPAAGAPADPQYDGNAYWSNATGTRNFMDDTGTVNPINSIAPYTNVLDIYISGSGTTNDPFTNDSGGDFTLNNSAGAGALLRGTATPGALPTVTQVGYMDFGCLQSQSAASGAFLPQGWNGGFDG